MYASAATLSAVLLVLPTIELDPELQAPASEEAEATEILVRLTRDYQAGADILRGNKAGYRLSIDHDYDVLCIAYQRILATEARASALGDGPLWRTLRQVLWVATDFVIRRG
jgi:hypothetical protein